MKFFLLFIWCNSPHWARASSFTRFLDHTQRRTTVGRTPLDEWSARRRDLYLTTHDNHKRQTSMPPVEFEPTIPASERPQTHALVAWIELLQTSFFNVYTDNDKVRSIWEGYSRDSTLYYSNKSSNKMQQFHKFITWRLCVAQHVSSVSPRIIRSVQLH